MERIDLYDKYINNQLSDSEKADFDARLESDKNFASDFKTYLLIVDGICREVQQDNLDFGLAMKALSKDQLCKIIGKDKVKKNPWDNDKSSKLCAKRSFIFAADRADMIVSSANKDFDEESSKEISDTDSGNMSSSSICTSKQATKDKRLKNHSWIWSISSIAAVVIIAFTVILNIEKNARHSVDNAIYACAEISPNLSRSGVEPIDIKAMNDDELKTKLPELVKLYQTSSNTDEIADNGYALAMAYLRLHDRENAKNILEQLVARFNGNEDYTESVNQWKSILNLLK